MEPIWVTIKMVNPERILTNGKMDFNKFAEFPERLNNIESSQRTIGGVALILSENGKKGWFDITEEKRNCYLKFCHGDEVYARFSFAQETKYALEENKYQQSIYRKLGEAALDNIRDYGYPTWYEWLPEHWGTRGNAQETSVKGNEVHYVCTGGPSKPIFSAICKLYPDENITFETYYREGDDEYIRHYENDNGEFKEIVKI